MGTSALVVALVAAIGPGATLRDSVVKTNNEVFQKLWGTEFVWKFDDLPTEGSVPSFRVPYSGYIYPDAAGGTSSALRKYDQAFSRGRSLATSHEAWDTSAFKKPTRRRGGLLGLRMVTRMETPNWHGHCNGWASAAMRHAEPVDSVRVNGVVFSPADIKALLAEIYMYNDLQYLDGLHSYINAGALHAILANWLGRGGYPIGMEADPGEEKWNYPIYGFTTSHARRGPNRVEVKLNVVYAKDSSGEYQDSPRIQRVKYFHYMLELNARGEIVGGSYYNDGNTIDMLWVPLRPKKSRTTGNESGNPYVDVEQVLAIWRQSVPDETRRKWFTIDPTPEDRILDYDEEEVSERLVPVQLFNAPRPASSPSVTVTDAPRQPATGDMPQGDPSADEEMSDTTETDPLPAEGPDDVLDSDLPDLPTATAMPSPEVDSETADEEPEPAAMEDPFWEIDPQLAPAAPRSSANVPAASGAERTPPKPLRRPAPPQGS